MPAMPHTPGIPEKVVLLVEDDPDALQLYAKGLEHQGFRVVKAGTAAVALQRARELGRIDVLVTDVVLMDQPQGPTVHGIELMRRMMVMQPDVKVVLFSGHSKDTIEKIGGIPAGTTFLEKPFHVETLVLAIKQLLTS
jgi:DNA-binding response OmpR family regulator